MKIGLAVGGTAGHLYPAFAAIQALQNILAEKQSTLDARVFGPNNRGEEEITKKAGFTFANVTSAPIRGQKPTQLIWGIVCIFIGTIQALLRLAIFRPDVILSTGGYGSLPASIAGRLLRLPLVVFLPDIEPGLAIRFESKIATHVATTTHSSNLPLPKSKLSITGYPVRKKFGELTKLSAREELGLNTEEMVLFISGASQGSQLLNNFVFTEIETLCKKVILLHITGHQGISKALELRATLPAELANRYHPESFYEDLPVFMFAANLSIMRAGASILGELPAANLPAILIPGLYAGGHQRANAQWLADQGGALIVEEKNVEHLGEIALEILTNKTQLEIMKTAMHSANNTNAAENLANLLIEAAL